MLETYQYFLSLVAIVSLYIGVTSFRKSKKGESFTETPLLAPFGIFVWGDALVFVPFWLLTSSVCLILHDWYLFLLIFSLFWVVRSIGETIYWFNQQFSTICRNPPERMVGFAVVKNDAVWYLYQIAWQCVTVISLVASLYCATIWIKLIQ